MTEAEYLPYVKACLSPFRRTCRREDVDDLLGAGAVGLAIALQRFDPTRGVKLATFAQHHIAGQIRDERYRLARERARTGQFDLPPDRVGWSRAPGVPPRGATPAAVRPRGESVHGVEQRMLSRLLLDELLERAPDVERTAMQMRLDGLSAADVASRLQMPTAAVRACWRGAVRRWRTVLARSPRPVKVCGSCGVVFAKRPNETAARWAGRRFCRTCGQASVARGRWNRPSCQVVHGG